jgi:hypothetical protein
MDRGKQLTNGQGADMCILTARLVHNDRLRLPYEPSARWSPDRWTSRT